MNLEDEIKKVLDKHGVSLAEDLNESFNKALKDGGSKNPQEAKMHFDPVTKVSNDGINLQIIGSGSYWRYVEQGRRAGSKRPPSNVFGKKWQNLNNVNPSEIVYDIMVKYNKKKGLTRTVKKLSFANASKQLSYILSASIGKKGIKAKPFRNRVVNDQRFDLLKKDLAALVGKSLSLEIKWQ